MYPKKLVAVAALLAVSACVDGESISSLTAPLPWQPPEAEAILSFTFDDSLLSQMAGARILEGEPGTAPQDSFRGTFFIVSGYLKPTSDSPEAKYMSYADVRALRAAGHEIGGHAVEHLSLSTLVGDPYELRHQVCDDRRFLAAMTGHLVGFAYPRGDDAGAHDVVRDCGYAYARDAGGLVPMNRNGVHAETVPPRDRLLIASPPSVSAIAPVGDPRQVAATAAGVQAWLEGIRDSGGGWLPITIHHLREGCGTQDLCMELSELRALVAWLRTHPPGIAVRTMDQVMLGDPLVPNPSLEQKEALSSGGTRPRCYRRYGRGSEFSEAAGRTSAYAEVLKPTRAGSPSYFGLNGEKGGCSIPVTTGRSYEVRMQARAVPTATSPTADAQASLYAATVTNAVVQPRSIGPALPVGGDWQQLSYVVTPPPGVDGLVFGLQHAGGGANVQVDDFAIIER